MTLGAISMISKPIFIYSGQYSLPDQFSIIILKLFSKVIIVNSIDEISQEIQLNPLIENSILIVDSDLISECIGSFEVPPYLIAIVDGPMKVPDDEHINDILYISEDIKIESQMNRIHRNMRSIIERRSFDHEVSRLYEIGKSLGAERNVNQLIDHILEASMDISGAEAGSFYSIVDTRSNKWSAYHPIQSSYKFLKFEIAKNKQIPLTIQSMTFPISQSTIVGSSIISSKSIRIDDVNLISDDVPYSYDASVEKKTGYNCKSMLTIPMRDQKGKVLGAIQLINKKQNQSVVPFNTRDEKTMGFLSGYAAIAFENSHLYLELQTLVEDYEKMIHAKDFENNAYGEELSKLNDVIDKNPIALLITDPEGLILYANRQFSVLTGYSDHEVLGKSPSILESGKMSPEFYKLFWDTLLSGEEWHGEFLNRKKTGELYWEKSAVSSIKNDDGQIKYFINTREDITELKNTNEKLSKAVSELKQAQSVLVQNEKTVAIGQLAAGMAHEINNPLGFISSNIAIFSDYSKTLFQIIDTFDQLSNQLPSTLTAEYAKVKKSVDLSFLRSDTVDLISETNDGLQRVKKIVEAMRAYSNIDRVSGDDLFSVNEAIETALTIFNSIASDTCIVERELQSTPYVYGDIGKFQQALMNILLNAVEAINLKKDGSNHSVCVRTLTSENNVRCIIEDDGVGIAAEHLSHIFDPFFTTKPIGEGAGLGLSQAHSIINQSLGGKIKVESKSGEGSTFTIEVPITHKSILSS